MLLFGAVGEEGGDGGGGGGCKALCLHKVVHLRMEGAQEPE